jgi:hypothetical protein
MDPLVSRESQPTALSQSKPRSALVDQIRLVDVARPGRGVRQYQPLHTDAVDQQRSGARLDVLATGAETGRGWATLPLAEAWGPFFPDVPAAERTTHEYPVPESDAFWASYAEPVGWFLGAASHLRDAVLDLSADPALGNESATDFVYRLDTAARLLHGLLSPVQPSLTVGPDGEFRQTWRTRSLLSSFALMALLDLTERRRVLTCRICGRVFVSAAYQALYCSERCRGTGQKRAYRARIRRRAAEAAS